MLACVAYGGVCCCSYMTLLQITRSCPAYRPLIGRTSCAIRGVGSDSWATTSPTHSATTSARTWCCTSPSCSAGWRRRLAPSRSASLHCCGCGRNAVQRAISDSSLQWMIAPTLRRLDQSLAVGYPSLPDTHICAPHSQLGSAHRPLDVQQAAFDRVVHVLGTDRRLAAAFAASRWPVLDDFVALDGSALMLDLVQASPGERCGCCAGAACVGCAQASRACSDSCGCRAERGAAPAHQRILSFDARFRGRPDERRSHGGDKRKASCSAGSSRRWQCTRWTCWGW